LHIEEDLFFIDFRKIGSALLTEKIALSKLHLSTRSAQV